MSRFAVFLTFWSAFAVAVFFARLQKDVIDSTDSYFYLKIAQQTAEGKAFTHPIYSPGYSWFVAPVYLLSGELEASGRAVSLFFAVLTLTVVWMFFRRFFRDETAFFTVVFISLLPSFSKSSTATLPWTCAMFFFWASLLFLKKPFFAGAFAGVGYIVRPEIALVLFPFLWMRKTLLGRLRFSDALLFLAGTFIFSLPYHLLCLNEGNPPSALAKFLLFSGDGEGSAFRSMLFEFLLNFHSIHKWSLPKLLTPIAFFLAGAGFFRALDEGRRLFALAGVFLYLPPLFFILEVPWYVLLHTLPFFGFLFSKVLELRSHLRFALLTVFVAFHLVMSARPLYRDDGLKVFKDAGRWIRENLGANLVIYEPFPYATFYAGGIWTTNFERAHVFVFGTPTRCSLRDRPEFLAGDVEGFRSVAEFRYKGHVVKVFVREGGEEKR